jgi:sugar O-acyltransferase (sialic acid O-acetyltransferase NeuD family)
LTSLATRVNYSHSNSVSGADEHIVSLFIFGAGGHGRGVLQLIRALAANGAARDVAGFIVEPGYADEPRVHGVPVHVGIAPLLQTADATVVVAIASPAVRRRIVRMIGEATAARFPSLVYPQMLHDDTVAVGAGSVLFAGLLAGSDVRIGCHVLTHHHVHLGHDCVLEDFVTVAPGSLIGGGAHIGEGAELGMGARVLPKVRIGCWTRIGAGAVVTRDIPDHAVAYGVPARVVSMQEPPS